MYAKDREAAGAVCLTKGMFLKDSIGCIVPILV